MALSLTVIAFFGALALDVGILLSVEADLEAAADAAALAGAEGLSVSPAEARARAVTFAGRNSANGGPVVLEASDVDLGTWNPDTRVFTVVPDTAGPDSVRVRARLAEDRGTSVSLYLARSFGFRNADIGVTSIAHYRPRDIVLALDYSASMNDDSELKHIGRPGLTREAIESNLRLIWTELGSPSYGNMTFEPRYIESENTSEIFVELALAGVPYPYPGGSWSAFINYVKDDRLAPAQAGYHKQYGSLTLVNYWLDRQPAAHQTPGLWMTSEQPISAVKDAVDLFLLYLEQISSDDRVGLSAYTYTDQTAILESGLTTNFNLIRALSDERQAGHYDALTNIAAGMQVARQELENRGRPGAFRVIVLLTDGQANLPGDPSAGRRAALDEAALAVAAGIPIITISLGADADSDLTQQIADITGGRHFNVPGGQSVSEYEEDLNEIFRAIAGQRPLRLVQ